MAARYKVALLGDDYAVLDTTIDEVVTSYVSKSNADIHARRLNSRWQRAITSPLGQKVVLVVVAIFAVLLLWGIFFGNPSEGGCSGTYSECGYDDYGR